MGAEVASMNGVWIKLAEGSGREIHVGGIEKNEEIGVEAADETREIFWNGGGVDAAP